jgi:hypothetical protein
MRAPRERGLQLLSGCQVSRKAKLASRLEAVEEAVVEVPPEEELTRPISGPPLLLTDLRQETVPLMDLYLDTTEDSPEGETAFSNKNLNCSRPSKRSFASPKE